MKIRILCIAGAMTSAALFAGCTAAVYRNPDTCEQLMRSRWADTSQDKLSITHTGTGIYGSRVVVEGTSEHIETAAEAASDAAAASAASAASAAVGASAAAGASGAVAGSGKPAKPKKILKPAAVECTFSAGGLSLFRWLAPPDLAKSTSDPDSGESAQ